MWDNIIKTTKWKVDDKKLYFTEGMKDGNLPYLIHTDEIPLFMSNHHKPATTFFMKYTKGKKVKELRDDLKTSKQRTYPRQQKVYKSIRDDCVTSQR